MKSEVGMRKSESKTDGNKKYLFCLFNKNLSEPKPPFEILRFAVQKLTPDTSIIPILLIPVP